MRVKIFHAASAAAAMDAVRSQVGDDALILSTERRRDGSVDMTVAIPERSEEALPDLPLVAPVARIRRSAASDTDPTSQVTVQRRTPRSHRARDVLQWHGVTHDSSELPDDASLIDHVRRSMTFTSPVTLDSRRPLVVAGPAGGGKTMTVARLLAGLVKRGGVPPMVISTDTSRGGALAQLAAYTRPLGVPLFAADDSTTLRKALDHRAIGQPVLIDTGATDIFSKQQAHDLDGIIAASGGSPLLVLPAGLDFDEAHDTAKGFSDLGCTSFIATRLDVGRRIGGLIAAGDAGLTCVAAGIGLSAADGLQAVDAETLSALLEKRYLAAQPAHVSEGSRDGRSEDHAYRPVRADGPRYGFSAPDDIGSATGRLANDDDDGAAGDRATERTARCAPTTEHILRRHMRAQRDARERIGQ
ncbi:flagellar GTP-binding protein FlhF [Ameyamaea chiangmaiensis NBRC 103196]|uniref:SRP54-type proteins GTP-binding domain-containing protein n=1 Tax=Ameyamaea chiangmaiensis TaxID=442969 RepID=A0A850P687_9PROT|nr:hypothetical protein [Ameyamaea chiangmaiensis]MBS4074748.1 hypothetical protein [Ameyamaea chiangmaiensis]NVN40137.1 hypothetical protein [Ameyamaea chiangmaiensis]GBQ62604.1 flagellar GTP-binding protein FlhF [Ameyamaea chiangmaiensis NBRC 103196]